MNSFVIPFVVMLAVTALLTIKSSLTQSGGAFNKSLPYSCNKSSSPPGTAYSSLYTSDLSRSIYNSGRPQDQHFSSKKNPAPFTPPCLTKKPYGNSMSTYYYWKYLPNMLEKQYASCDKYGCSNKSQNGYTALPRLERCTATSSAGKVEPEGTLACDPVNQEYYNSSEDFCRTHPEHYPCANWWMNNPAQIRDVSRPTGCTETIPPDTKMAPQVLANAEVSGFCLAGDPNCKLDDGRPMLMIQRHREDHGLC